MSESFSEYVAWRRKQRGLTQKDLAEALGFTSQGISRFEKTDSAFDLHLLRRLCVALDVSPVDIFRREKEAPKFEAFELDLDGLPSRLKALREKAGIPQSDLAIAANVTSRSLRAYERGDAIPSAQTLERIGKALSLEWMTLLEPLPAETLGEANPSVSPKWKRRIALSVALSAMAILAVGIPLGVWGIQRLGYMPGTSYVANTPSALTVEKPYHEFEEIGEEIELKLYDPDRGTSFVGLASGAFALDYRAEGTMELKLVDKGQGVIGVTLLKASSGDAAYVNATVRGKTYEDIAYFRYTIPGRHVELSNGTTIVDGYFFDDGAETIMDLQRQIYADAQLFLKDASQMVVMPDDVNWDLSCVTAPAGRYGTVEGLTCGTRNGVFACVQIDPKLIMCDDLYFFASTWVNDAGIQRYFTFAPWHVHLQK